MPPAPLIAATGAIVGRNPHDPRSWSGSSARLLMELERRGLLAAALGLQAPVLTRAALLARTMHPNRARWRVRLAFEPAFRTALTRDLARSLRQAPGCDLLQFGCYFHGPAALAGRARTFSYHDGNLARRLASPYPLQGVSAEMIDRALAYEREVAQSVDLVLTMSAWLARSFVEDYGVRPERVIVIGGGMNWDAPPAAQQDKDYSRPVLIFVGADFRRKGGPQVLEAFRAVRARFPEAELHIAGPRILPIDRLPTGVTFHGHVTRHRLAELFQRASLFVMPSLYEPFGIAPLEAMAHQLPAVVSGAWALAETVEDGVTGAHVRPGDAEHLAEVLCGLLAQPERLAHMGQAAREKALARHTWPAVVDRLEAVIA